MNPSTKNVKNPRKTPFIDRVQEMKLLENALDSADNEKGGMILVRGEAGIGKSRLLNEILETADEKGFNTMFGKCLDYRRAPYLPFTEMLRVFFHVDPSRTYQENMKNLSLSLENNYPSITAYKKPLIDFFYKKDEPHGGFHLEKHRLPEAISFFRRSGFRILLIGKEETIPDNINNDSATEIIELGEEGDNRINPRRLEKLAINVRQNITRYSHTAVIFTSIEDLILTNQKEKVRSLVRICSDIARSHSGIAAFGTENTDQDSLRYLKPLSYYLDEENDLRAGRGPDNTYDSGPALSLFDVIFRLFREISKVKPALIIIEDLHWGDKATFNLLQYLARKAKSERIMILCSYREEEADIKGDSASLTLRESLQRFSREHLFTTIHLNRFNTDTTMDLLKSITGEEPSDILVSKVMEETDGNPLFVMELMNVLESGNQDSMATGVSQPISASTLVGRRLDSLDEESRAVLEQAAVFGDRVDIDLVVEAMGMDQETILDILDKLISLRFLREYEDGFAFEHQKVRESVYELIDSDERRVMHSRCATILEKRIDQENIQDLTMISHHHMRGGDCIKSLNYLLRIPGSDTAKISHEEFSKSLLEGYEGLKNRRDSREVNLLKVQTLQRIGDLEEEIGHLQRALDFYKKAISISEREGIQKYLSSCYRRMGDLHLNFFEWENTVDYYLRSLHISKKSEHHAEVARAFRGLGKMYYLKGDYTRSLDCIIKYLEFPNPEKGRKYVKSIILLGDIYFEMGDFNQALTYYKLAIKTAQEKEEDPDIAISYLKMARVLFMLGDTEDSKRFCQWSRSLSSTFVKGYTEPEINLLLAEMMLSFNDTETSWAMLKGIDTKSGGREKDRFLIGEYMRVSGSYYAKSRDFKRSKECYNEALEVFKKLEIPYKLGLSYLQYGLSLFQNMEVDNSIEMLTRAHQTFKSIKSLYYQNRTSSKLREVTFVRDSVIG